MIVAFSLKTMTPASCDTGARVARPFGWARGGRAGKAGLLVNRRLHARLDIDPVVVDLVDRIERQAVVTPVGRVTAGEDDRLILDLVDRADVLAIAVGNFHMLLDAPFLEHAVSPVSVNDTSITRRLIARSAARRSFASQTRRAVARALFRAAPPG